VNVFYLHDDPKTCAEMHCDKHVVKMIIEYAQLMSTAHRVLDGEEYFDKTVNGRKIKRWRMKDQEWETGLMLACHFNHPSGVWTRWSRQNYFWLNTMWQYLLKEYTHRYGKHHACEKYGRFCISFPKIYLIEHLKIRHRQCQIIVKLKGNSIASYHKYYINEKVRFAKWTKREIPLWYLQRME
jgi:hypothetical protein